MKITAKNEEEITVLNNKMERYSLTFNDLWWSIFMYIGIQFDFTKYRFSEILSFLLDK
jgi:hypothetical protein